MSTARLVTEQNPVQEFSLRIPGIPELGAMARSFLKDALVFAEFQGEEAQKLLDSACGVIASIEAQTEQASDYVQPIDLRILVEPIWFRLQILEHGPLMTNKTAVQLTTSFDKSHWKQYGSGGSQLEMAHRRPHAEISTLVHVEERLHDRNLHQEELETSKPSSEKYRIRMFQEQDAVQISQQIYATYGRTYFNEDFYYPDRIIAGNQSRKLHSAVAETSEGEIVGHCALERPTPLPIAELGIAVVEQTHRGHGLLGKMEELLLEQARKIQLDAIWALPVAWHPYSQRMNLKHGWQPCGIALNVFSPIRLGTAQAPESIGRITAMMHVLPIAPASPITAFVPDGLAEIVGAIYEAQGREVTIDTTSTPPTSSPHAEEDDQPVESMLSTFKLAVIQAHSILPETLPLLRQASHILDDFAGAEVMYLDLPITHPNCAWLANALLDDGFVFGGIGPRFLGEDSLRLQKPITPFRHEGLAIEGELAQRITDEVLQALRP